MFCQDNSIDKVVTYFLYAYCCCLGTCQAAHAVKILGFFVTSLSGRDIGSEYFISMPQLLFSLPIFLTEACNPFGGGLLWVVMGYRYLVLKIPTMVPAETVALFRIKIG